MHKLDRNPAVPGGLQHYRHGRDTWSMASPNGEERAEIWAQLGQMQGWRCAYCEADIAGKKPRHIEHFRQRDRYAPGTFDWRNLFGSCNRVGTCGDHKDKCGRYDHGDLIKPDQEDPEDLLVFLPNGAVRPRARLQPAQLRRAEETIRILQLDAALQAIRRNEVAGYVQTAEEIAEFFALDPVLGAQVLADELAATAQLPFATAIKHVLSNQSA